MRNRILQMSRTPVNYWCEFALDIPVGVMLVIAGLRHHNIRPSAVMLTITAGLLLFSFIEYGFHRWLFHGSIPFLAEGHREHHLHPLGFSSLPFFLPAMLLMVLAGLFDLVMPVDVALLLTGTIALGYVSYGLSHFVIHHLHFRSHRAQRWAANHLIHHRHPGTNFGVTTPLWDLILSTRYVRRR